MPKVTISEDVCKGCGLCIVACPRGVLALHPQHMNNKGYSPAYPEKPR